MKKADFILIGVVLGVALVIMFFLYGLNGNDGAYVEIEVDGSVTETLPLDEETVYEIAGDGGVNTLVIEGGYAFMLDADCPDKICVKHSKINKNGESIICLPHKVVVTVVSEEEAEVDL